ncbi:MULTISPECIES: HRDC domain-containing protein [Trueperella]|uniref:Ribonuclease D n=1 Tax=Trueperella abortisuis TaxID=445930 RepID=A0ABT9PHX4_9ACTO|nr:MULTISPECIES: HRDC domain-containing protein [Trueperella]MCI7304984.1 HRDC domain-containing protein [Trueperella sp.]MDP9832317.1 ribonuclease D [Trueperella abortisuis]MDY5403991.1 HRDC domain-containing protein [Trueperella sp.]
MTQPTPARLLDKPRDGLPPVTGDDIDDAVARLAAGTGPFGVDTERANEMHYSSRAYLIQIRREGTGTVLIDPLGIEDRMAGLAEVMRQEWILHAAHQDLVCLAELGLRPTKVFDTEIAALILGYDKVSLQAVCERALGWTLAKEYSRSDWAQRPLPLPMLTYAALDVELLGELREVMTGELKEAGRYEWFLEECEEVRLRKPPPPRQQPWRRSSRQAGIRDQRALAMLRELWSARDELARRRDLAPHKVIPNNVLAQLAKRKPRSRADVANSSLLRTGSRRRDVDTWWRAIDIAWHLDERALPERRFTEHRDPFPPTNEWEHKRPEAAHRWAILRPTVLEIADELAIRQEVVLKPRTQKIAAWNGWDSLPQLEAILAGDGARPWQIELTARRIHDAVAAG